MIILIYFLIIIRYGLIGRNGTGKTTLMRAFANREIPEIPGRMSILHVEQEVQNIKYKTDRIRLLETRRV